MEHCIPTEGQPLELLTPDPHPQDGVNQDLNVQEPVSTILGVILHNLISHVGHAHKPGEVEVEGGAGAAIYLL